MSFTEKVTVVLNQITDKFQEHPKENEQSYMQHFWNSSYFSLCSLVCSVVFMLHAIFPFLFEKTGGNLVYHLEQQISGIRNCSPHKSDERNTSETEIGLVNDDVVSARDNQDEVVDNREDQDEEDVIDRDEEVGDQDKTEAVQDDAEGSASEVEEF